MLTFIVVFSATIFLSVLAAWTGVYNPVFPLESGWLEQQIAATAGAILLASVFVSLYLVFFRIRKKPGNRFFSFVLPLGISFVILLAGITLVYGPPGNPIPRAYSALVPFVPRTIHETDDDLVYVGQVSVTPGNPETIQLENVVRYAERNLTHYSKASALVRENDDRESTVIVPRGGSGNPVPVNPANPIYEPVFEKPGVLSSLIKDVELLNNKLLERRAVSPERFTLALFSVLLLATSCICFSRLTRWPLFNVLFTLVVFRGIFFLVRFLESDIGTDIRGMIPNQTVKEMLFTFVFLGLGVLFTAVNFAFPGKRHG